MLCNGMSAAQLGKFRCETIIETWEEDQWEHGEACTEKCEQQANFHGPGCCEARIRENGTAYCIFGRGRIKGHSSDSKAVDCKVLSMNNLEK